MHPGKLCSFTATSLLFLFLFPLASPQQCRIAKHPRAIYSKTRLPNPEFSLSAIYDGQDSILIFNGRPDDRALYQFNIISEEITKLVDLPVKGDYAPVARIQDGSFLYFGNVSPQRVFRYDLEEGMGYVEADYYYKENLHSSSTWRSMFTSSDPNKIYLVVNPYDTIDTSIYEFDTSSYCVNPVLNITGTNPRMPVAAFGTFAYLFDRTSSGRALSNVTQINRETMEVTELGPTNVAFFQPRLGVTVTSSKYIYMLGGYSVDQFPYDGILQYHPADNEFKFIMIDGMPLLWESHFESRPPAMVFVEKLNRIYFFGGGDNSHYDVIFDHIWYIDVGLME